MYRLAINIGVSGISASCEVAEESEALQLARAMTPRVDLTGGSIYTLAMDGPSEPVQLTSRKAGSDADPAWSPDGTMIAFRRRGLNDNSDV